MKYTIVGEPLPAVICDVEAGETLITESRRYQTVHSDG